MTAGGPVQMSSDGKDERPCAASPSSRPAGKIYGGATMDSDSCRQEPGQLRDVLRVKVQDQVLEADRALLRQHCEYFRALFRSGMRDCVQEEVHLGCVGASGFLVLLQVLNGERPALDADQIVEAIECAAFLQAAPLLRHLMDLVDSDNCLLMLHTAAVFGARDLLRRAALFVRDVHADLRAELRALPQNLVAYVESLAPGAYVAVCSHSPAAEPLQDPQRTVCYLDEEEDAWKVLTQLPLGSSTSMAGVAVLDDKLYVVGGVHDTSKAVVETGFCYDPVSDTWSTFAGPGQRRYNFTLIGHAGCLYAVGGEREQKAVASVEKFVVSDSSWSAAARLPCPASSVAWAQTMSRVFVGLWRGRGATDLHEYLPGRDEWRLETTLVREHSYALAMLGHRDCLYVTRNGPGGDFLRCRVDCYCLSSGQWTEVPGQFANSKGALLTAAVRGDSVFTLNRMVTREYAIEERRWRTRREMAGFGRIGTIHAFVMRLPKAKVAAGGRHEVQTRGQRLEDLLDGPRSSRQRTRTSC